MAARAVELAQEAELPILRADAAFELAQVLSISGQRDEAQSSMNAALTLYSTKGDAVSAARAHEWLGNV